MTAVILIYSWPFPMEKTYIYYWYKQFQNISFPFSSPCKMKLYQHLGFYQHFISGGCLHHLRDHAQANLTSLTATGAPKDMTMYHHLVVLFHSKTRMYSCKGGQILIILGKICMAFQKTGRKFISSVSPMLVWQLEPNQHHPCLVNSLPTPAFNPHHEDSTLVVLK